MPQYIFKHPKIENTYIEVFQHMKDDHTYETEEDGETIVWARVYTVPQLSIDAQKIDVYSENSWRKYTENKKGTVGDLMDVSSEWSERRAAKEGKDPIKEKLFDNYEKKRKGIQHPERRKEKLKQEMDKVGFNLE